MAGQFQYQPITGPVWREPVAERLAWQPRGQQPARALPPNRLGDYAPPVFAALYRPDGLQWLASDRYAGQPRPFALARSSVLDPIPPTDPRLLAWQPQDRYAGRSLARASFDTSVYPRPVVTAVYDPQTLEWIPSGIAPRVLVERRIVGDFQQPPFPALFRSEGLQWQPSDRYAGRALSYSPQSRWIIDPTVLIPPPFDPQGLQWLTSGSLLPYRGLPAIYTGAYVVDPTTPPDQPQPTIIAAGHRLSMRDIEDLLTRSVDEFSNPEMQRFTLERVVESNDLPHARDSTRNVVPKRYDAEIVAILWMLMS